MRKSKNVWFAFSAFCFLACSITHTPTAHAISGDGQSNQQAAKQTSSAAGSAGIMNTVMGGALMIPCASTPPNIMACVMAAQSFMQAGADSGAQKAANNTYQGFNSNLGTPDPAAIDLFKDGPFKKETAALGIKDNLGMINYGNAKLDELTKQGFKLDPKTGTVTTPDGKTFSSSSFSSPQAMAAAGFSAEQIQEVEKITKPLVDKFKVAAVGLAGGGGGGGGSYGGGRATASYNDPFASMYGSLAAREQAKEAQTGGLSRQLSSGESIGTQSDSIFEMISRSYKRKNNENIFVSP